VFFIFVFVSVRAHHRLTACGQHHFVLCTNIIVADTKRCNTYGVNDVALWQTVLCFAQTR